MLLSSHTTPISSAMVILFMAPLDNDTDGWEKRLTLHGMSHPINYTPQQKSPFGIYMAQVSLHPLSIWRDQSTYFFPRFLSHQSSSHAFQIPDHPGNLLATIHELVNNSICSDHFSFKTKCYDPMYCPKFCSLWRFFFIGVSFRVVSESGYNATAVRFWIVPE